MTGNKKTTKRLIEMQGNMTLRAFAEKCGIGQSTLHNYLKGRDMKLSFAAQICQRNGRSLDWLVGISEETLEDKNGIYLKMAIDNVRSQAVKTEQFMKDLEGAAGRTNDNHRKANERVYQATKGALRDSVKDENGHFIEKT